MARSANGSTDGDAPAEAACAVPAGLIYVTDRAPGITRRRRGKGFAYRRPDGSALRSATEIQRIRRLAIPPAYERVWICPSPDGHIQATGRDARGRKQYRYHPLWRVARDGDKFARMLAFGLALRRIRERVAEDLQQPVGHHVHRSSLLAALVRLLDTTLIRVGNDEYARTNGSFGLTTLRSHHARLDGSRMRFRFRGKSGILHEVSVHDPRVARVVRECQAMPGQELFHYEDEAGALHGIGSADVNAYLREASGDEFTAKDFRTWHGSAHALHLLVTGADRGPLRATEVLSLVARRLGNTPAVCKKSYVHPLLLEWAAKGVLDERIAAAGAPSAARVRGLAEDERALLRFLRAAGQDGPVALPDVRQRG